MAASGAVCDAGECGAAGCSALGTPTPEESRQLATRLLNCYASLLVEFTETAPTYVTKVSSRPVASAYVRRCARQGHMVTNMRMESITLSEPSRLVLSQLDGRHDRGPHRLDRRLDCRPSTSRRCFTCEVRQTECDHSDFVRSGEVHRPSSGHICQERTAGGLATGGRRNKWPSRPCKRCRAPARTSPVRGVWYVCTRDIRH